MTINIDAYALHSDSAIISPLPVNRDWMEETPGRQAYHCFPMSLANQLGWGISFKKDISFILHNDFDNISYGKMEVISGQEYVSTDRQNGVLAFKTGLALRTNKDFSLLVYQPPNVFINGCDFVSVILSTSFIKDEFQPGLRVNTFNKKITIKAGTPIAAILPIDLSNLDQSEVRVSNLDSSMYTNLFSSNEYRDVVSVRQKNGVWSDFYRNATDHLGNKIGEHQVKKINLKVV
jgi:hypothetical protein